MHELTFADSALPPQTECLAVPLAAYTLGHELILLRHRSPFLCLSRNEFDTLPAPLQVLAITFAVQVCAAHAPGWWWKRRRHDYPLAIADFRNYLEAHRQIMPALSSENEADAEAYEIANKGEQMSGGRSMGSPFIAQLINFCLTDLRLTYQEALDSPFGVTANLYFAAMESKGQMRIENQKEAEARADMAAKRAEVKAENAQARAQWLAAVEADGGKPGPQAKAAYEGNPRIGMVFGGDWNNAKDDTTRHQLVEQWGPVALLELDKAGVNPKTFKKSCQD